MERVALRELYRRLEAYGLTPAEPDGNVDLAQAALGLGRKLVLARVSLHADLGLGDPILLLELEGPGGREVVPVVPGPRAFQLLESALGPEGTVETDILDVPAGGLHPGLGAPTGPRARPAPEREPPRAPSLDEEEERVFARIVAAANPGAASELLARTVDVLLEEVDGERGIVALARDGRLVPEVARLRGGRDIEEPRHEVPRRIFEKVAAERRPVYVEDMLDPALSLVPSDSILAKRVRSFLAAPLLGDGEVTGVFYVDRRDRPTRFDARARSLFERLAGRIGRALHHALVLAQAGEDLTGTSERSFLDLIGGSAPMLALFRDIQRIAEQDVDALILGETGTGKELVARALHQLGRRKARRFEVLNCAALPETLLDSVLFGHVRGAFTGADRDRQGLFAEAHGGTLFLDEVGDMPPALQAKLLRTLELGEVRPVGSARSAVVDVRLIAATNKDLAADAGKTFREDLYYRLTAAEILQVPPLRERPEDVAPLARHFLRVFASRHGTPARSLTRAALERLAAHPWPGNVRELRSAVLHTALRCKQKTVGPAELVFGGPRRAPARFTPWIPASEADVVPLKQVIRDYLLRVHELANGNVTRMAKMLGEPRTTVRDRLRETGIATPRRKEC